MVLFTNVALDNHFTRESTSVDFEVFNGFAQNAVVHKFNKIFPKLIGCAFSLHLFQITYGSIHHNCLDLKTHCKFKDCEVDSCCTIHLIFQGILSLLLKGICVCSRLNILWTSTYLISSLISYLNLPIGRARDISHQCRLV